MGLRKVHKKDLPLLKVLKKCYKCRSPPKKSGKKSAKKGVQKKVQEKCAKNGAKQSALKSSATFKSYKNSAKKVLNPQQKWSKECQKRVPKI